MTDHGGLILIAPNKSPTDSILYSWNSGITFTKANFTDPQNELIVQRIHHPHDPLSRSLLVQGVRNGDAILVHVDFTDVHQRECTGVANPTSSDSDYEFFKPHSYESDKCLLGRYILKMTFFTIF
jgi:hypothetical protein